MIHAILHRVWYNPTLGWILWMTCLNSDAEATIWAPGATAKSLTGTSPTSLPPIEHDAHVTLPISTPSPLYT